jgi:hypothetical protein
MIQKKSYVLFWSKVKRKREGEKKDVVLAAQIENQIHV